MTNKRDNVCFIYSDFIEENTHSGAFHKMTTLQYIALGMLPYLTQILPPFVPGGIINGGDPQGS